MSQSSRWRSAAVVLMFIATLAAPVGAGGASRVIPAVDAFDLFEAFDLRTMLDPDRPDAWAPLLARWGKSVPVIVELGDAPLLAASPSRARYGALEEAHRALAGEIVALGGTVTASYAYTFNGLAATVPRYRLAEVAALSGVRGVFLDEDVTMSLETSVPFVGTPDLWAQQVGGMPVRGQGMKIAIIDTGIDYTHAALGGSGNPEDYAMNDPNVTEPGTFPTAKVVFGWDFVGSDFNSRDPTNNTPKPDPDPLDENGHGTHVASIAAGTGAPSVGEGVAPEAVLYAIKVFGRTGSTFTSIVVAAIELALDPNRDGDMSDKADVINLSLGSLFGHEASLSAIAANRAAAAGTVVVAAAGNAGNVPYITDAPAVASGAISAAASQDDGIVFNAVRIDAPASLAGIVEAREGAITKPLAETGDISDDLVYVGRGCSTTTPPDAYLADPNGSIALIDRGACTFSEKILRAQAAGAIAVVVANSVAGDPIVMGGDPTNITIPGVMISRDDGSRIKAALSEGSAVTVTLSASFQFPKPDFADTLASFTSRGPTQTASLKPDVSAPGADIRAAARGTGTAGRLLSGTSMATPHVAGAAALLRQLHPDWSVEEIKALLMNTAMRTHVRGTNAANPGVLEGAGRIDLSAASRTSTLAIPASVSFGVVPVLREDRALTATVEIRNKGDVAKEFDGTAAVTSRPGVALTVDPSTLQVEAGESAFLTVRLALNATALTKPFRLPEIDGTILLTQVGADPAETLRVRIYAVPFPASDTSPTDAPLRVDAGTKNGTLRVRNEGLFASDLHLYALGATDPNEPGVPDLYDIQAVGVRMLSSQTLGPIIEFGVATYAPWPTPNVVEFDVYIDVDADHVPDFVAFTVDFDLLSAGAFNREIYASALLDLKSSEIVNVLGISTGGTYNQQVLGIPVAAKDLNLTMDGNTTLQYAVLAFGQFAPFDVVGPRGARNLFPALAWDIATPPLLLSAATLRDFSGEATVNVTVNDAFGSVGKRGLLLLEPRDAPGAQADVVTILLESAKPRGR